VRADASTWASNYAYQHEQEVREERRQMYIRRRRALLWTPLACIGAVLLVQQVTADIPVPLFVFIGIGMLLPWVADC
jgi:hypothetical protein